MPLEHKAETEGCPEVVGSNLSEYLDLVGQ